MRESIQAIYNTLSKLQMLMTPENAKHMAGIYIKLEELYREAEQAEKDQTGGD